jgi:hypothetical protein
MIDRISKFMKGIFNMNPTKLPADQKTSRTPRLSSVALSATDRTLKLPENTAQGCRDRATANLLEAVTVITANHRRRLERSAEGWTVRAALLDRVSKSFDKQDALERAHSQYETDHVRL